jgi:hypothetical protein
MAHPHKAEAKSSALKRLASYKSEKDSAPYYESPLPPEDMSERVGAKPARKAGGRIDGEKPKGRLDRAPRRKNSDEAEDKALIAKEFEKGAAAVKKDAKPAFARGGGVKSKGKTTVNVIIAPQGGDRDGVSPGLGGAMMPPGGAPPMPALRPPMPPQMAGPTNGMPPQGVPMRKDGGRVRQ